MNDMSGVYSEVTGAGSLVAARMAVDDLVRLPKAPPVPGQRFPR
jgi:hypothetical protein